MAKVDLTNAYYGQQGSVIPNASGAKEIYVDGPTLPGILIASQTMTVAGTATFTAPGLSILRVDSDVDIYVSYGAAPDAVAGPRVKVRANETNDYSLQPGDKVAWALA